MSAMPILNPAPNWLSSASATIKLYHGCTNQDRLSIETRRQPQGRPALYVDVRAGRIDSDFGRGFYTTTIERQARYWAWQRYYDPRYARTTGNSPMVLVFEVERHLLAKLQSLSFAIAGYNSANGFWSLVQHCRQSDPSQAPPVIHDHNGPVHDGAHNWFDICYGPVSAFWVQQAAVLDSDQVSFHTDAAAQLLNSLIQSGSGYSHYVVV
jgi:Protein of unknown function (DUF3990)